MSGVSTYLSFDGRTEDAFAFYREVFRAEPMGDIVRIGDLPAEPGTTRTPAQARRVAHMALAMPGGHHLHGTDVPSVTIGDNVKIMLEPASREEADRLAAHLPDGGGRVMMPMADQPWGAYFGQIVDRYGVQWLIHHTAS